MKSPREDFASLEHSSTAGLPQALLSTQWSSLSHTHSHTLWNTQLLPLSLPKPLKPCTPTTSQHLAHLQTYSFRVETLDCASCESTCVADIHALAVLQQVKNFIFQNPRDQPVNPTAFKPGEKTSQFSKLSLESTTKEMTPQSRRSLNASLHLCSLEDMGE